MRVASGAEKRGKESDAAALQEESVSSLWGSIRALQDEYARDAGELGLTVTRLAATAVEPL
jgi:hypothetical protein